MGLGSGDQIRERIAGSGVDLPGLHDRYHWTGAACESLTKGRGHHPSGLIGLYSGHTLVAQAQKLQGREHRCVGVFADHDVNGRGTEQSFGLNIPTDPPQNLATCGGKANKVRNGCPGHKPNRSLSWKVE